MSLYADYIEETTHGHVLETEKGFVVYVFPDEKTCYIKEIFVSSQFRHQGVGSDISAQVIRLAKQRGCTSLLGSVTPSAKGSTQSLRNLIDYGFKLESCSNDFILLRKDLY